MHHGSERNRALRPEILGGTPVFVGTRFPVDALVDFLKGGDTIEYFLKNYPASAASRCSHFSRKSAEP
jgi:uncharacterized protein (DUF433 family)